MNEEHRRQLMVNYASCAYKLGNVEKGVELLERMHQKAPSGMVGLETSLALTLTQLYHTGKMELPDIIRRMSTNPASILKLQKGRLTLGSDADITIFDPNEEWIVNPGEFASKGRNTPFGGYRLKGKVKYTIVAGKIIYQDK